MSEMNEWEVCISEWADRCRAKQEEIDTLAAELATANEELEWWRNLVTRACIGTTRTPSLKAYVEQLEAALAAVKAERDDWKRKYDIVHDDPDYATCCQRRDHWKAEAVWAMLFVKARRNSTHPDYQRAQAVLKEAGGE